MIRGRSPALGRLRVYFLSPKPLPPSALERMAGLLCGDARFGAEWIEREDLPFPARGHAVIGEGEGSRPERLLASALASETRRALGDYRGRVVVARYYPAPTISLYEVEKALEFAERVGARLELKRVGTESWIVLRSPRPLGFEERHRFLHEYVQASDVFLYEDLLLERLGLPELAGMAPTAFCWRVPALPSEEPWKCEEREAQPAIVRADIWGVRGIKRFVKTPIAGPRGVAECSDYAIYVWIGEANRETVGALKEAQQAAEELGTAAWRWSSLARDLERAAEAVWQLPQDTPWPSPRELPEALTARAAEEGRARVWEEGGAVRVWAPAERLKELDPERLRILEGLLGRRVVLVSEEPPFRWSPEVDAAAERLRRALARAVGSA